MIQIYDDNYKQEVIDLILYVQNVELYPSRRLVISTLGKDCFAFKLEACKLWRKILKELGF